jgi:hypothetical protein
MTALPPLAGPLTDDLVEHVRRLTCQVAAAADSVSAAAGTVAAVTQVDWRGPAAAAFVAAGHARAIETRRAAAELDHLNDTLASLVQYARFQPIRMDHAHVP